MRYGARNQIKAKVVSVKKGDVMSQVRFTVENPHEMQSVLTTESVEDLDLKPGETVLLAVKAVHVIPIKE
ncbi:MAG: TOBE domain-containing protein [Desulfovibrionales bacterium]|nr:TOBE domain-containing protein [Desulfovibrionales bacterium]